MNMAHYLGPDSDIFICNDELYITPLIVPFPSLSKVLVSVSTGGGMVPLKSSVLAIIH